MMWGNWIVIHEQMFGSRQIDISFDTSASAPSTFTAEIKSDTQFNGKTIVCPCSFKIQTSESPSKTRARFKSNLTGQFIDVIVKEKR